MPNRIIKESCRTSPTLAMLSDAAERLFWRLTTAADDYGRFEADPDVIKGSCLPRVKWAPKKVEMCMQEFSQIAPNEDEPLVTFYTVKGRRYGQFAKWEEHQRKRDSQPKFPGPEEGELAASCGESRQVAALSESERRETRDERRETVAPVSGRKGGGDVITKLEEFALRDMTEFLKDEGVDLNAGALVFTEFKDYWRSVGGKRAGGKVIKDWPATFRNRIRQLKAEGKIKLAVPMRTKPALVIAEPARKDPPTDQAKAILSKLMPNVAGELEGAGA